MPLGKGDKTVEDREPCKRCQHTDSHVNRCRVRIKPSPSLKGEMYEAQADGFDRFHVFCGCPVYLPATDKYEGRRFTAQGVINSKPGQN